MSENLLKGKKPFKVTEELRRKVIEEIRETLKTVEEVSLAVIFGSFTNKKHARDIDIAIYLNKQVNLNQALEYAEKISKKLQEKIKLPIDITILNIADEPILIRAILKGKPIIVKNQKLYQSLKLLATEVKNRFILKTPK